MMTTEARPAEVSPAEAARLRRPQDAALPLLRPLLRLAALPLYAALRLAALVVPIRIGLTTFDRIGHFSFDTEMFLRKRAQGLERGFCVLVSSANPCNRQILAMLKRAAAVVSFKGASFLYVHGLLPWLKGSGLTIDLSHKAFDYRAFAAAPPQLKFSAAEDARGRAELARMGLPPEAPFVCFHARDKAYLRNAFASVPAAGWSYHDYRDCDIANYLPAAERLAARGLHALRMGQFVEKPLGNESPRIVDYASRFRSDFADAWLLARCKFFLGNTAGLYSLATTFDTPVAVANWAPFGVTPFRKPDLVIHKKFWDAREDRPIGFRELWQRKADYLISSDEYARAGIRLVENTADEIAELAEEMNARLDGTWVPAAEDEELQKRFWDLFPADHPGRGRLCRVGASWLRKNPDLLD